MSCNKFQKFSNFFGRSFKMLVSSTQHEHNVQALLQSNGLDLLLSFANTWLNTQVHYPREHVMCGLGMKPN